MPDAYLAGGRGGGGGGGALKGLGRGRRARLLLLDTEMVDRAGDGSLWLAEACERFLLPPNCVAEDWDACGSVRAPSPEADPSDDPESEYESESEVEESPGTKALILCLCHPQVPSTLV